LSSEPRTSMPGWPDQARSTARGESRSGTSESDRGRARLAAPVGNSSTNFTEIG
jgi:hypothetical protein